jgi:sporulation protein YlmC with PRC-barrel domain
MAARMTVDELPGRSVIDSTGRLIGHVMKAVVDLETWAIEALRLRLARAAAAELGLPDSLLKPATLEVPTGLVLAASDAVILRATLEELHGLVGHPVRPTLVEPAAAS